MQDRSVELQVRLNRIDGNDPINEIGVPVGTHQVQLAIGLGVEVDSGRVVVESATRLFERHSRHRLQVVRSKGNATLLVRNSYSLAGYSVHRVQ